MKGFSKGARQKFIWLYPRELRMTERDSSDISGLAESIRYNGLLNPITVRRRSGGYEIICGVRRFRACIMAGVRKIPCLLLDADDRTAAVLRLTENIHHSDADVFTVAEKTDALMRQFNISYHETAGLLGMSQPDLVELLGMLRFTPEQRRKIAEGKDPDERQDADLPETPQRQINKKITDLRLYINSLNRIVGVMRESGFDAKSTVVERDGIFEFTLVADRRTLSSETESLAL